MSMIIIPCAFAIYLLEYSTDGYTYLVHSIDY